MLVVVFVKEDDPCNGGDVDKEEEELVDEVSPAVLHSLASLLVMEVLTRLMPPPLPLGKLARWTPLPMLVVEDDEDVENEWTPWSMLLMLLLMMLVLHARPLLFALL